MPCSPLPPAREATPCSPLPQAGEATPCSPLPLAGEGPGERARPARNATLRPHPLPPCRAPSPASGRGKSPIRCASPPKAMPCAPLPQAGEAMPCSPLPQPGEATPCSPLPLAGEGPGERARPARNTTLRPHPLPPCRAPSPASGRGKSPIRCASPPKAMPCAPLPQAGEAMPCSPLPQPGEATPCSPLPLAGEGPGERARPARNATLRPHPLPPCRAPSPASGRGETHTLRIASKGHALRPSPASGRGKNLIRCASPPPVARARRGAPVPRWRPAPATAARSRRCPRRPSTCASCRNASPSTG